MSTQNCGSLSISTDGSDSLRVNMCHAQSCTIVNARASRLPLSLLPLLVLLRTRSLSKPCTCVWVGVLRSYSCCYYGPVYECGPRTCDMDMRMIWASYGIATQVLTAGLTCTVRTSPQVLSDRLWVQPRNCVRVCSDQWSLEVRATAD